MIRSAGTKTILVVDDDPAMRAALAESLRQLAYPILTASNGEDALVLLKRREMKDPIAAIITDMKMPGMNGMALFHEVNKLLPQTPVIIMSAFGTIETAVDAMKSGVFDYLVKPFTQEALEMVIRRALPDQGKPSACNKGLRTPTLSKEKTFLARDPAMVKVLKMAKVVAASQATILIEAESGTGKELLARYIHEHSPRAHRPFIAINCAAVPEGLLESELFGYEKGAFTGALKKKPGRFELAHKGTLLLDEVCEMHLSLQAKLLRVLQEREVDLLGSKEPVSLDIRVIATTNRPLLEEVKGGRFREDLYYRLNVFPLRLPPLRGRLSDIPLLVDHFLKEGASKEKRSVGSIAPEALSLLMAQEWRGNVRELENVIERAVILAEGEVITSDHLLFSESAPTRPERSSTDGMTVWEAERNLILETLEQVGGNRTHAARILGISIRTLRNKLKEYRQADSHLETAGIKEAGKE